MNFMNFYIIIMINICISRANMAGDAEGKANCLHGATDEFAAWHTCGLGRARGCARVRVCAHMCVIIVSGLSILFKT